MNAQFGTLLKFYALRHARDAFAPTEELERATLTQLNFEGLSLECDTIVFGDQVLGREMQRRRWSTSLVFDAPCTTPEQVEDQLVKMFAESEAAAAAADVEEGGGAAEVGVGSAAEADGGEGGGARGVPPSGYLWGGLF
uniref:Uncharacterized protein n=1 Tax=Calcidiscus leptoporus TaxID=127549 RepID=A0A7S0P4H7_9EUKA